MKRSTIPCLLGLGLTFTSHSAFAAVVVIGGLSNFDVVNNTGQVENEFEIEMPNVHASDISGYWANTPSYKGSGYGFPTAHEAASTNDPNVTSTYVNYTNPTNIARGTTPGFTEHFGIHFVNPFFQPTTTLYRWKNNGSIFDYNMPSLQFTQTTNPTTGVVTVTPTVVNNTNNNFIVDIDTVEAQNEFELGELVETEPEVEALENEIETERETEHGAEFEQELEGGTEFEFQQRAVDLHQEGNAALFVMRIFEAGSGGNGGGGNGGGNTPRIRGRLVANVFSALNTAPAAAPVPLPAPLVLLESALCAIGLFGRRRQRTSP